MPALPLTVSPGALWEDGSEATPSMLNLTANPSVVIQEGSITSDLLDTNDIVEALKPSMAAINYLPWGSFHWDQFMAEELTCDPGKRTETFAGWHVNPSGTYVFASKIADAPDEQSGHCLQVTATGANPNVQIGTYLPPQVTTLAQGVVIFSLAVFNDTGVSITPSLIIVPSAAGSEGNEGVPDTAIPIPGTGICANGIWTRIRFPINPGIVAPEKWKRGAHVILKIDTALSAGKSVRIAQAGLDKGTESPGWIPNLAELSAFLPGLQLPWPGEIATIPAGWLFCNGAAVPQASYPKLYSVIGDRYKIGAGPGAGLFNLPDLRGTVIFGAEVAGTVPPLDRAQITVIGCAIPAAGGTILVLPSTANLRYGMGILHANYAPGTTIIDIMSETQLRTSTPSLAAASDTIRFSKLGGAGLTQNDPQIVGAAGSGMPVTGSRINIAKLGVSTSTTLASTLPVVAAGYILSMPNMAGIACGMLIDCPNVPPGTKVATILTAGTLEMTQAATLTAAGLTATFRIDAGAAVQEATYQHLLRNPVLAVVVSSSSDNNPQTLAVGGNVLIKPGWYITGTGINPATGIYVSSLNSDGVHFNISANATSAGTHKWTFSFDSLVNVDGAPPGPRWLAQNWMIKT